MKTPHWTTYAGIVFAALALAWQLASAWFDVQHRLRDLEKASQFIHGDVTPFMEEK